MGPYLSEQLTSEKIAVVIPWLKEEAEPLCGLYRKTALAAIESQLKNRKVAPTLKSAAGKIPEVLDASAIEPCSRAR